MNPAEALAEGVVARNPRAVARAISWVEDAHPEASDLLNALYPRTGQAWTIGITGPPGAGKSTVVDGLVSVIRKSGLTVGVIAVDPASPFSGGAILGDRIRMASLSDDASVFVRSMSNRGHLGGLATATEGAVAVLDAAGFEVVVVETVGVGQSEIEVAELADTTVLIQPPHLGDGVQAVKAGIMEVPQLFVINKSDLPGAKQAAADIENYLDLVPWDEARWRPPVVLTTATQEPPTGLSRLWDVLQTHREWSVSRGHLSTMRANRLQRAVWRELEARLKKRMKALLSEDRGRALVAQVMARELPPGHAADRLLHALDTAEPRATEA